MICSTACHDCAGCPDSQLSGVLIRRWRFYLRGAAGELMQLSSVADLTAYQCLPLACAQVSTGDGICGYDVATLKGVRPPTFHLATQGEAQHLIFTPLPSSDAPPAAARTHGACPPPPGAAAAQASSGTGGPSATGEHEDAWSRRRLASGEVVTGKAARRKLAKQVAPGDCRAAAADLHTLA